MPRPLILILAILATALVPASASAADFFVSVNRQVETGPMVVAQSNGAGSIRLVVERSGAAVLDVTSPYQFVGGPLNTRAGDVVKIFQPHTATQPSATLTLDDRPTIDQVCAGAPGFTGKLTNSASSFVAGAQTYNPFGNRSADRNYGRAIKTASDAYAVQLSRPARLGEYAVVIQRLLNPGVTLSTSVSQPVVDCSKPPAPTAKPTDGLVTFHKRDVRAVAGGVRAKLKCSPLSAIACVGNAKVTVAGKRAGAKSFTIAAGQSKRVTVKLSKRVLKKWRKRRKITIRLTVTTKNQLGATLTRSARVTLRHPGRRR